MQGAAACSIRNGGSRFTSVVGWSSLGAGGLSPGDTSLARADLRAAVLAPPCDIEAGSPSALEDGTGGVDDEVGLGAGVDEDLAVVGAAVAELGEDGVGEGDALGEVEAAGGGLGLAAGPDGQVAAAGGGDDDDGEDGVVGVGGDAEASGDGDGRVAPASRAPKRSCCSSSVSPTVARESAIRCGAGRAWREADARVPVVSMTSRSWCWCRRRPCRRRCRRRRAW